jgi:protein-tyrosine kinase
VGTIERALNKISGGTRAGSAASATAPTTLPPSVANVTTVAAPGARHALVPRTSFNIDRTVLEQARLLVPEEEQKLVANQFRAIKRPIIANAFGTHGEALAAGHLVMVASALPGEGKTFNSFNLALSMAQEQDLPVVLVDADTEKPEITNRLGLGEQIGLLDFLDSDDMSLADVLIGTDLGGLFVIPCGKPRPHAAELLTSQRMQAFISQLAAACENGMAVFDSAPLLLTNESRVLGGLVGQVVLVVAANKTPQAKVLEAMGLIHEDKGINLVLNRARYGYQSYGYGYPAD